jgi:hypothetical protein
LLPLADRLTGLPDWLLVAMLVAIFFFWIILNNED